MRTSHQAKLVLQAFLDSPADEVYGFELANVTNLKAGTLYPILQRLLAEGWVTDRWEDLDEQAVGRRRRRYYRLTGDGTRAARAAVAGSSRGLRSLMPGWAP
jgi:PadR family transcriptional regulator, regulatory protein PadR